ncbi:hypothetical protein SEPCBS119000_000392 [Sporothrix epigloea]|uniref:Vacuolar protein sorting-associated protein 54 C-terminal domain-containing protein n=1 Tax=Sporothrix epigloea TaxID=1892477 RepID=A0ABP0D793_9PEZI
MFANSDGRKSVDSLTSPGTVTHRPDFPFHNKRRRGSVASSVTSIGGSLDTALGSWPDALHEAPQNAISTLLQPPIVRTGMLAHLAAPAHSTHKPPTSRDIPPVALTNIEHVETSEFTSYLRQVGALHEQLRRVRESEDEQLATTVAGTPRRNSSKDDLSEDAAEGYLRPGLSSRRTSSTRKTSISSISSATHQEAALSPVRRSSSNFRRPNQGPPPLSTIPSVYFDESFHLENPRTFDIVSERAEIVPAATSSSDKTAASNGTAPARKILSSNAILQEKLSWYMDTVEIHLISSISTASTAFFTALGSLKELHTEAAESVDRVKALRAELLALDEQIAVSGLDVLQKQRRRQNIQQFHSAVLQLQDIVSNVAACETLVDEGEVDKALNGIHTLEKLIAGEESPRAQGTQPHEYTPCDLRGATALQGVSEDVSTLRYRIGKAYEAKLVSILMSDLRQHASTVSRNDVLMRWNSAAVRARGGHSREPSTFPAYLAATDNLRSELLPIIVGLCRAKHIGAATQAYREAVLREIRSLIRRPLPSSNNDDNESMMSTSVTGSSRNLSQHEKSSILARNLRALDPQDAEELLTKIYIGVTETLRRFMTQSKVLLDVATSVGDEVIPESADSRPTSPSGRHMQQVSEAGMEAQAEIYKTLDINNLLGQAVDVAQDKIVKLLRVRQEQSSSLSLTLFLRYFSLNSQFANECESISIRSGTMLKNVVNVQIKDFLRGYGDTQKQKLAQAMDQDQWAARDFTDEDNDTLQQILTSSTKDAPAWAAEVSLWIPAPLDDDLNDYKDNKETTASAAGAAPPASSKAKMRSAAVDEESFLLPHSAVLCLKGVSRFMHLAVAIPFMTADVSSSLVQYLQLFNSRCTQLILGAGATKSAGLKNITTRNLAIASQALSFLATLVPYVREFIRRRASSVPGVAASSLMGDFDKVRRLYQEHQNSIYEKLMEIMSGRAQIHARSMAKIDWDNDESEASVHLYMETLVKDTITLHRNLVKTLPDNTVQMIMVPVFSSYAEHLGNVLTNANVKTKKGQDNMMTDLDYFKTRLSKIDGFEQTGEKLKAIVTGKVIEPPPPPSPPAVEASAEKKPSNERAREEEVTDKLPVPEAAERVNANAAATHESNASATADSAHGDSDNDHAAPPPPPPKDDAVMLKNEKTGAQLETESNQKEQSEGHEAEQEDKTAAKQETEPAPAENARSDEKSELDSVETSEAEPKPKVRPEEVKKELEAGAEADATTVKAEAKARKNKKKNKKKAAAKKAAAKEEESREAGDSSDESCGNEK